MKSLETIKRLYPNIFELLGVDYLQNLERQQGVLALRPSINPFFPLLHTSSGELDCARLEEAVKTIKQKSRHLDRLKKLAARETDTNLANYLNELLALFPVLDFGELVPEQSVAGLPTPDFEFRYCGQSVGIECVSENRADLTVKEHQTFLNDLQLRVRGTTDSIVGSVFAPKHKYTLNSRISRYRKLKGSHQLEGHDIRIILISFNNTRSSPDLAAPFYLTKYGFGTGLLFSAFYGRKDTPILHPPRFHGKGHMIELLETDGRLTRGESQIHLAILHFNRPDSGHHYVFFENLSKPLPTGLLQKLEKQFRPNLRLSVLRRNLNKDQKLL